MHCLYFHIFSKVLSLGFEMKVHFLGLPFKGRYLGYLGEEHSGSLSLGTTEGNQK